MGMACSIYRSFATIVSQLKICDFSGETFKGFEVLLSALSATTTQLLSSGEFCKLRYDTIPVQNASANVSIPITQKYQILSYDTLVANERNRGEADTGCWSETLRQRYHLEDQGVDGRTILKWILS